MKPMVLHFVFLTALLAVGCHSTDNLKVVQDFDIDRYLGRWYEAARFPHRFEKGLTAVTADYSRNPDGMIKVVNCGYDPKKQTWKQAEAVGKFKDDPDLGWLKVSFFWPFYADYKILYLDEDYTKAIVTGPTYNYLWILARNPALPDQELDRLTKKAHVLGFDTNRIERIDQTPHL